MLTRKIEITQFDYDRLWRVAGRAGERDAVDALENELDGAKVVPTRHVAPDVVTMNTRLEVEDLDTGARRILTIVFPEAAQVAEGKVSVLAPLGLAILGARVGQLLEADMPRGRRRMRVQRILFQPEASGRFDL